MTNDVKIYSLGKAISKAFSLYFNNLIPLTITFVIVNLIGLKMGKMMSEWLILIQSRTSFTIPIFITTYITSAPTLILSTACLGFVLNLIHYSYFGKKASISQLLPVMITLLIPLTGLAIVKGLLISLGYILLIIPALIWQMQYFLAPIIMVCEKKGILDSMKRSKDLIFGYKSKLIGWLFLLTLITGSPYLLIFGTGKFKGLINLLLIIPEESRVLISQIVLILWKSFTNSLQYCIMVIFYYNIKIKDEGFDIEYLTDQFNPES